jgi:hypothetical protein
MALGRCGILRCTLTEKNCRLTTYGPFSIRNCERPSASSPHEHFEKFPNWHATEKGFSKIDLARETELVKEHRVVLSDLDIVNHVNNVKYLNGASDTLQPKAILKQQSVNEFHA